jgi:hypothetical protein
MTGWTEEDRRKMLAASRQPEAHFTAREVGELLGAVAGLNQSGSPMQDVGVEPDRDYADDADLFYVRGGTGFSIRMTPADQEKVFAALATAARVRSFLAGVMLSRSADIDPEQDGGAPVNAAVARDLLALQRAIDILESR